MSAARAAPSRWNPVSAGQNGLWYEQQSRPDSNAYNLAGCVRFTGAIDAGRIDAALALLAARHPMMRARFALEGGEPSWRIAEAPLSCRRLQSPSDGPALEAIVEFMLRPYDLAAENPYRFALAAIDDGTTLFGIGCHHIASDLHSLGAVVRELGLAYGVGAAAIGEAPRRDYAAFVERQRAAMGSAAGVASAAWWRARLAETPGGASLGDLESGSGVQAREAGRIDFALGTRAAAAVAALSSASGATPFAVLLTAFQCLLSDRMSQSRVVVGAPSSGRNDRGDLGTVGYFVNLLPMVLDVDPGEPFERVLARNHADVREALSHGQHPFGAMVRDLQRAGAADPAHLVQATLSFQKTVSGLPDELTRLALGLPGGGLRLGDAFGEIVRMPELRAQFPLGIAVASIAGGFAGCVTYEPARIGANVAAQLLRDWEALVELCGEAPGKSVAALLASVDGDLAADLCSALDAAMRRHGERIAVSAPDGELLYRDLRERAAAIARQLRAAGIGAGHRVAVLGAGGAETVCALVGVMRAGAAFVPLDADIDPARARTLLAQAKISALLRCDGAATALDFGVPVLDPASHADVQGALPFPAALDPAWLMFTSGTTGHPKAAVVPHEAALAHARGIARRLGLNAGDRVLQFASLSFDEHAEEIFPSLLCGACVVCRPRVRFQDPEAMLAEIDAARVSVLHLPTSYWHLWMDEAQNRALGFPRALRLVNAGGEQASVARLRTWTARAPAHVRWVNTYGLTEAAVTSLAYEARGGLAAIEPLTRVPAGRPLRGTRVRVVAGDGSDVGAGETGELWLGGPGVR